MKLEKTIAPPIPYTKNKVSWIIPARIVNLEYKSATKSIYILNDISVNDTKE